MRNKILLHGRNEYSHLIVSYGHSDPHTAHMFLHKDWGPKKIASALKAFAKSIAEIPLGKSDKRKSSKKEKRHGRR